MSSLFTGKSHQFKFIINGTNWKVSSDYPITFDHAGNQNNEVVFDPSDPVEQKMLLPGQSEQLRSVERPKVDYSGPSVVEILPRVEEGKLKDKAKSESISQMSAQSNSTTCASPPQSLEAPSFGQTESPRLWPPDSQSAEFLEQQQDRLIHITPIDTAQDTHPLPDPSFPMSPPTPLSNCSSPFDDLLIPSPPDTPPPSLPPSPFQDIETQAIHIAQQSPASSQEGQLPLSELPKEKFPSVVGSDALQNETQPESGNSPALSDRAAPQQCECSPTVSLEEDLPMSSISLNDKEHTTVPDAPRASDTTILHEGKQPSPITGHVDPVEHSVDENAQVASDTLETELATSDLTAESDSSDGLVQKTVLQSDTTKAQTNTSTTEESCHSGGKPIIPHLQFHSGNAHEQAVGQDDASSFSPPPPPSSSTTTSTTTPTLSLKERIEEQTESFIEPQEQPESGKTLSLAKNEGEEQCQLSPPAVTLRKDSHKFPIDIPDYPFELVLSPRKRTQSPGRGAKQRHAVMSAAFYRNEIEEGRASSARRTGTPSSSPSGSDPLSGHAASADAPLADSPEDSSPRFFFRTLSPRRGPQSPRNDDSPPVDTFHLHRQRNTFALTSPSVLNHLSSRREPLSHASYETLPKRTVQATIQKAPGRVQRRSLAPSSARTLRKGPPQQQSQAALIPPDPKTTAVFVTGGSATARTQLSRPATASGAPFSASKVRSPSSSPGGVSTAPASFSTQKHPLVPPLRLSSAESTDHGSLSPNLSAQRQRLSAARCRTPSVATAEPSYAPKIEALQLRLVALERAGVSHTAALYVNAKSELEKVISAESAAKSAATEVDSCPFHSPRPASPIRPATVSQITRPPSTLRSSSPNPYYVRPLVPETFSSPLLKHNPDVTEKGVAPPASLHIPRPSSTTHSPALSVRRPDTTPNKPSPSLMTSPRMLATSSSPQQHSSRFYDVTQTPSSPRRRVDPPLCSSSSTPPQFATPEGFRETVRFAHYTSVDQQTPLQEEKAKTKHATKLESQRLKTPPTSSLSPRSPKHVSPALSSSPSHSGHDHFAVSQFRPTPRWIRRPETLNSATALKHKDDSASTPKSSQTSPLSTRSPSPPISTFSPLQQSTITVKTKRLVRQHHWESPQSSKRARQPSPQRTKEQPPSSALDLYLESAKGKTENE